MIRELEDGLIQVRGWFVTSYILVEQDAAFIIDGGFIGDLRLIARALESHRLKWEHVRGVLLTHGHLDHTYNVSKILERAPNARLYAHHADWRHIEGTYPYKGISRICGWLEWAGRKLLRYRPPAFDRLLVDEQFLDIWGRLKVVHTPGHTLGHCGFYSLKRDLLFSGDLFANWLPMTILPWPWLNSCPEHFPESLRKVLKLDPKRILTNHCGRADAATQRDRFVSAFGSLRG